jgi:hypothetical protein
MPVMDKARYGNRRAQEIEFNDDASRLLFLFLVAVLLSGALFVQRQFLNSVPGAIS